MEVTINIKEIWKKFRWAILGFLFTCLSSVYYFSKDIIDEHMARQHAIEFKTDLILAFEDDAIMDSLFSKEAFIVMFFESPIVKERINGLSEEMTTEIRNFIIEDVSHKDTLKVSTRAEMSKRLDIREENYFPLLEKALRAVLKEENASKKDAQNIAKKTVRKNVKPSSLKPAEF